MAQYYDLVAGLPVFALEGGRELPGYASELESLAGAMSPEDARGLGRLRLVHDCATLANAVLGLPFPFDPRGNWSPERLNAEIASPDEMPDFMIEFVRKGGEGGADALDAAFSLARRANKYIDETAPWVLAKDETKKGELQSVMYHLADSLRIVAALFSPFMPKSSEKIAEDLGLSGLPEWDGLFGADIAGLTVKKSEALFPRIDADKVLPALEVEAAAKKAAAEGKKPKE
ncbi:MAG: hypothetical protein J6V65_05385, partial [Fibrobacterales bacterium]|nr:hypothetical protein [Fibrobacterales bacterium]